LLSTGVVDQIVNGEDPACNEPIEPCDKNPEQALCKYKDQVDVFEMEADLSVGPVFARHIGHRLYRGEYYYTQSDAHVSYTQNWDADIISQMEATGNEMAVLTTYLTDVQGSIDENGHSLRHTRPIMCNTNYEGHGEATHLRHRSQPERMPSIHGVSQMEPYWAAGYSFSRGHFVVNVPYDLYQPMIFQGEEMSIGIRGFTVGYDMYAPERSVCFHHYAVGKNAKTRNNVPHFWENGDKFKGIGKRAMARLLGIVHMNPEVPADSWDHTDEEMYGLGGVRTPEKFYETFGIDVFNKKTEHHLCRFVDKGVMHRDFQKLLRSDGMGVDYGKITYKFRDPAPGEK
jgi:[Skp1-protein]-hydroxyproline N-acetylglucosaminyltransferase